MVKVRIRGVDRYVRDLVADNEDLKRNAIKGVRKAAEYLLQVVKGKIGSYQSSGGGSLGFGPWPKLKFETIQRKLRKYGVGNKPLLGSGDLRDSFTVIEGGKGRISASVGSNDQKLVHHVYGAPGAGVPKRDPILVTANEERDKCHDIIIKEIMKK